MAEALYDIHFRSLFRAMMSLTNLEDVKDVSLCNMKLRAEDITHFRDIIEDLYYFEFIIGMNG